MSIPAIRRKSRGPQATVALFALVLAMLLAQALGFAHRVLHQPHAVGQGGSAATWPLVPGQVTAASPAWVDAHGHGGGLFQHNEQDPACRIFDQAGSADSPGCVPAIALPMALSSYVLLYFQGEVLARQVALFDARAPPPAR